MEWNFSVSSQITSCHTHTLPTVRRQFLPLRLSLSFSSNSVGRSWIFNGCEMLYIQSRQGEKNNGTHIASSKQTTQKKVFNQCAAASRLGRPEWSWKVLTPEKCCLREKDIFATLKNLFEFGLQRPPLKWLPKREVKPFSPQLPASAKWRWHGAAESLKSHEWESADSALCDQLFCCCCLFFVSF